MPGQPAPSSTDAAQEDAVRIRAAAEREAAAIVDAAHRRADAFAEARIARVRELTDRLIATAEAVERRFGDAVDVAAQLDALVHALGAAAQRAAHEHQHAARGLEPVGATGPGAARVLDVGDRAPAPRHVS